MRRTITITLLAGAALAALYGGVWWWAAGALRAGIDDWIAARKADNWHVSYSAYSVGGFPFVPRARITEPKIATSELSWRGDATMIIPSLWPGGALTIEFPGAHHLTGPHIAGGTARVTLGQGQAEIDGAPDGGIKALRVTLSDLQITAGAALTGGAIGALVLNWHDANGPPSAPSSSQPATSALHERVAGAINIDAHAIALPPNLADDNWPLGRVIARAALQGQITGSFGAPPIRAALQAWRDGGGTVEIDGLALTWAALDLTANGTLALDDRLQPIGAFDARIAGYDAVLTTLVASGAMMPRHAVAGKLALDLIAQAGRGGRKTVRAPLAIQEGWLFLGPVRIAQMPIIAWP